MINFLNEIDTSLFLALNEMNSPFLDPIMLAISYNKFIFMTLLIALIAYGFTIYKKYIFLAFFFCLIGFGLSDSISSKGFKDNIKRLRPCHNEVLRGNVHTAGKQCWGGKYGFVSSHASNSFAIAIFFWLLFKKRKRFHLLFLYASLVSYSRIYLARHYPGDIFFGALLGLLCGYIAFKGFLYAFDRLQRQSINQQ
ncbi:MAG: undecaprenyl-diphosphatase [Bacteriovoracaceae bacterium]|jgi:undecaprenyl-diphosphatase